MAIYVPIVMYCLRLSIVVLQELHCFLYTMFTVIIVVCLLKTMCIPIFALIGCCVSELHGHLCPYRNVLPEAVYWDYKNYQIVYMFV